LGIGESRLVKGGGAGKALEKGERLLRNSNKHVEDTVPLHRWSSGRDSDKSMGEGVANKVRGKSEEAKTVSICALRSEEKWRDRKGLESIGKGVFARGIGQVCIGKGGGVKTRQGNQEEKKQDLRACQSSKANWVNLY